MCYGGYQGIALHELSNAGECPEVLRFEESPARLVRSVASMKGIVYVTCKFAAKITVSCRHLVRRDLSPYRDSHLALRAYSLLATDCITMFGLLRFPWQVIFDIPFVQLDTSVLSRL